MSASLTLAHLPVLLRQIPELSRWVNVDGEDIFGVEVNGEEITIAPPLASEFAPEIAQIALMGAQELKASELHHQKASARSAVIARANTFTSPILSKYPEAERAGWDKREAEARAIIAAGDKAAAIAATLIIKALAVAADETTAATVARAEAIVAKAEEFAAISAAVEIMRDTALAAIDAVDDPADLPATLEALKAQALALAAEYGLA